MLLSASTDPSSTTHTAQHSHPSADGSGQPPLSRRERAEKLRQRDYFTKYGD